MIAFERLVEAAVKWKAQFEVPPIELVWRASSSILYLNGIWICPYREIADVSVHELGFELLMQDGGTLTIIITEEWGFKCIERTVFYDECKIPDEYLNPSYHGELCTYNGEHVGFNCACGLCDFAPQCFPEWRARFSEKHMDKTALSNRPKNLMRKGAALRRCYDALDELQKAYPPIFRDDPMVQDYLSQLRIDLGEIESLIGR